MMDSNEPQEITEDEADLGFALIEFGGMGHLGRPDTVVARILSPSDVLVKCLDSDGGVRYSHRRWGYSRSVGSPERLGWKPLTNAISPEDAAKLIQEYDFVESKEMFPGDIIGLPFTYRKL